MKNRILTLAALAVLAGALAAYAQPAPPSEKGEETEVMVWQEGPGGDGPDGFEPGEGPGMRKKIMIKRMKGGPAEMEDIKVMGGPGGKKMMFMGAMGPGGGDKEMMEIIKRNDPAFAAKLEDLHKKAPGKYLAVLKSSGKLVALSRMEDDKSAEKDLVRGMSLEYDTRELSQKYDKASDGEKAKIKEELKAKVSELFDLRHKRQEMKIKRMEADLADMKKKMESRRAAKAKIVQERVDQLTGEGYSW